MDTRVARIKELKAKKADIDGELKQLKEMIKAEAASLRAPRKPRAEKPADLHDQPESDGQDQQVQQ